MGEWNWKDGFADRDTRVDVASVSKYFSRVFGDSIYTAPINTCHPLCGDSISCSFGMLQYGKSLTRSSIFDVRAMHVLICSSPHFDVNRVDGLLMQK